MEWTEQAEKLEIDRQVRLPCPSCKDNAKNLSVNRLRTGATAYCFKCAYRGFHKIRGLYTPVHEPIDILDKHLVPLDATLDIPEDKLDWLLKYGITPSERERFKIQYTPKYDRIVIPVYDGQQLVGSVSRRLHNGNPCKYITRTIGNGQIFKRTDHQVPVLVVVEDILSAIKVGRAFNAVSLLGTGVSHSKLAKVLRVASECKPARVVLWFDADLAGYRATKSFKEKWSLISDIPVYSLSTEQDPKAYHDRNIYITLGSVHYVTP